VAAAKATEHAMPAAQATRVSLGRIGSLDRMFHLVCGRSLQRRAPARAAPPHQ
jgi:hypothetical protein